MTDFAAVQICTLVHWSSVSGSCFTARSNWQHLLWKGRENKSHAAVGDGSEAGGIPAGLPLLPAHCLNHGLKAGLLLSAILCTLTWKEVLLNAIDLFPNKCGGYIATIQFKAPLRTGRQGSQLYTV